MKIEEIEHLLASRYDRFAGAFLDGLILSLIVIPILLALGIFQKGMNEEPLELWMQIVQLALGWIAFFGLNSYLLVTRGQTVGKTIVKTKIINKNEETPDGVSIIGKRYVLPWIISYLPIVGQVFGLVNALFIFRKDRRCLHDHLAGTYVIKLNELEPAGVVNDGAAPHSD